MRIYKRGTEYVLETPGGEHAGPFESMAKNIDDEVDYREKMVDRIREKKRLKDELDGLEQAG